MKFKNRSMNLLHKSICLRDNLKEEYGTDISLFKLIHGFNKLIHKILETVYLIDGIIGPYHVQIRHFFHFPLTFSIRGLRF